MLRFVADENFSNIILRGLLLRKPDLDVVRTQDTDLAGADDLTLLAWAATEGRIVLTHDLDTLAGYAYERMDMDLLVAGVLEVRTHRSFGRIIEDILILAECTSPEEWKNQVKYVPL
ncbi:MAG: DUF5615 family PIN-like protein [Chloroflexota bacterium]|nr:DUF5615 family PIN-like protein [Chloroflexota bacterium]